MKGLFLNSPKAQCSIHESGKMIYAALSLSEKHEIKYLEIDDRHHSFHDRYDFLAFNYHPTTMGWLNTAKLNRLPGTKLTFVLEVLPNNPFVMCPDKDFDVYCAIDPTMQGTDDRVLAFPRPLERHPCILHEEPEILTIGTFGFATPGKGFDLVVDAVNKEFDRAIVRINIPHGSYIGKREAQITKEMVKNCLRIAGKGIDVRISHDYMSKAELIQWCANNTLNVFLYTRNQPGLAATTDQAIVSRRPLAVSGNETFRHIHQYIKPYPERSLRESIEQSGEEVDRMQRDWNPENFARQFDEAIESWVIPRSYRTGNRITIEKKSRVQEMKEKYVKKRNDLMTIVSGGDNKNAPTGLGKKRVLFVSHRERACGIHQYGLDCSYALRKSIKYDFYYQECTSPDQLKLAISKVKPNAVIYNYYPVTMPWLKPDMTLTKFPNLGIMHEVTQEDADNAGTELFDYYICPDPALVENTPMIFRLPRLILNYENEMPIPRVPTIGSFGFGFTDKGFERIVQAVKNEFSHARLRFHIPQSGMADRFGLMRSATIKNCQELVRGTNIKLEITSEFLTREGMLEFLGGNSLNVFMYDVNKNKGISSVIDYALAVHVPIAINKCGMFRHIRNAEPSICIEDTTLKTIMRNGTEPLEPFYKAWSETEFVKRYEQIMDEVI